MIKNQKYHIITKRIPGFWNKPREFVLMFLGDGPGEGPHRQLFFKTTDVGGAGTTAIERGWIDTMRVVDNQTQSYLPRIYRG
jgi:hypothetical protein